jgi:hypothetical protein
MPLREIDRRSALRERALRSCSVSNTSEEPLVGTKTNLLGSPLGVGSGERDLDEAEAVSTSDPSISNISFRAVGARTSNLGPGPVIGDMGS